MSQSQSTTDTELNTEQILQQYITGARKAFKSDFRYAEDILKVGRKKRFK